MRTPTENQGSLLLTLGNGCMAISGMSGRRRLWKSLLNHGWVAPDDLERPDNGFRITPDGLRALARAVEKRGLPPMGPPRPKSDPPLVQRLRASRDAARERESEAHRQLIRAEQVIGRVRRALEEAT